MGARIVVRRPRRGSRAGDDAKLEAKAPGLGHRMHLADLSSMAETRKVGAAIAASEPRIDVLINNAGALFSERRVTPGRPRADLRAQPHGLFRADRSAARHARRLGPGAHRVHVLDRAPGRKSRLQRPAERQGLRRAQGLRPVQARQYPLHPRARPATRRNGGDRQLPPSWRRRDPIRLFERRLRRPSVPCAQAVLHLRRKRAPTRSSTSPPRRRSRGRRASISSSAKSPSTSAAARDDAAAKRLWEASERWPARRPPRERATG